MLTLAKLSSPTQTMESIINLQASNSLSKYKATMLEVRYYKRITYEQKNNKPRNARKPIDLGHETLSYNSRYVSRATSCKTC